MVDVGAKPVSQRRALAEGCIRMQPDTLELIRAGSLSKGDVLTVARIAGIQAAKRCADLIPLCHPLPLSHVSVDFAFEDESPIQTGIRVTAGASTSAQTGVEMEALTAVSLALLTIYDMAKAVDRAMRIEGIRLLSKEGGASATFQHPR